MTRSPPPHTSLSYIDPSSHHWPLFPHLPMRPGSAASGGRKTPKRVPYPEEQIDMTLVYDTDDAPSSSRRKGREKGRGKTKDEANMAKKPKK